MHKTNLRFLCEFDQMARTLHTANPKKFGGVDGGGHVYPPFNDNVGANSQINVTSASHQRSSGGSAAARSSSSQVSEGARTEKGQNKNQDIQISGNRKSGDGGNQWRGETLTSGCNSNRNDSISSRRVHQDSGKQHRDRRHDNANFEFDRRDGDGRNDRGYSHQYNYRRQQQHQQHYDRNRKGRNNFDGRGGDEPNNYRGREHPRDPTTDYHPRQDNRRGQSGSHHYRNESRDNHSQESYRKRSRNEKDHGSNRSYYGGRARRYSPNRSCSDHHPAQSSMYSRNHYSDQAQYNNQREVEIPSHPIMQARNNPMSQDLATFSTQVAAAHASPAAPLAAASVAATPVATLPHQPQAKEQAVPISEFETMKQKLEKIELENRLLQQKLENEKLKRELEMQKTKKAPSKSTTPLNAASNIDNDDVMFDNDNSSQFSDGASEASPNKTKSRSGGKAPKKPIILEDEDISSDGDDVFETAHTSSVISRASKPKSATAKAASSSSKKTKSRGGGKAPNKPIELEDGDTSSDGDDASETAHTSSVISRASKPKSATAKAASSSSKKTKSRGGGKATINKNLKQKLRQAQQSNNAKKKHELLKAYEKDMKAAKMNAYEKDMKAAEKNGDEILRHSEKDLIVNYSPEIIDHTFVGGRKFLVRWDEVSKQGITSTSRKRNHRNKNYDSAFTTWIKHEEFLFPNLAQKYLEKKKDRKCKNDTDMGVWIQDCIEQERGLTCLNTFKMDDDCLECMKEMDFCCFLCKCPWDHPLKGKIRNCENGVKFHRPCCHGCKTNDDVENFASPAGKAQQELLDCMGEDKEDSSICDSSAERDIRGEYITQSIQDTKPSGVTVKDCDPKNFRRCFQRRSERKRDAVILSINGGIGSVTAALKYLKISTQKVIHVEEDRVAQHVYRSNHDFAYGETKDNDGISHITGLYDSLDELMEDPDEFVRKHGPIGEYFAVRK